MECHGRIGSQVRSCTVLGIQSVVEVVRRD